MVALYSVAKTKSSTSIAELLSHSNKVVSRRAAKGHDVENIDSLLSPPNHEEHSPHSRKEKKTKGRSKNMIIRCAQR